MDRIAAIQVSASGDVERNRKKAVRYLEAAAERGAELVCFPELFSTPWFLAEAAPDPGGLAEGTDGPLLTLLAEHCGRLGVAVVCPFAERLADGAVANSAAVIDRTGVLQGVYRKVHLPELDGWREPLSALKSQIGEYGEFLSAELMPRTTSDFVLPPEQYAYNLRQFGVDMSVAELTSRAKVSFREIQNEMQALATLIAKERNLPSSDYRDVIRVLKKEQLQGEAILPLYKERIATLEKLAVENEIVSVPDREMRIRLASEAESAAIPAPHMRPPRLIGNTGEMGEFVLPLKIPSAEGEEVGFDDFTFDAASWTLGVHEGRPGHEMQFASIIERGVSTARALYAFNSTNVEGWALYMEAEMKRFMPLEGQLISLQHRQLRAARAFLDPGLQSGEVTREDVFRILENEVVLSHAAATSEVQRYTYRAPGQATSYFCGYSRLMELRADVERELGENFSRRDFHDTILGQGLLPPSLMRTAVMKALGDEG